MRAGLLIGVAALASVGSALFWVGRASAADGDGQNNFASVQASGGQLTIQADHTYWTPPAHSRWATAGDSTPPPGKPNPNQPYGCTYSAGGASATATLGVGGRECHINGVTSPCH